MPQLAVRNSLQIGEEAISEIRRLHGEILGLARNAENYAIRIGEILTQIKAALHYGDFALWIESNLPFKQRMARYYISKYDRRDEIRAAMIAASGAQVEAIASENGEVKRIARLHESRFFPDMIRVSQKLRGLINGELIDHPLDSWRRENLITLASALEPLIQVYNRVNSLIE